MKRIFFLLLLFISTFSFSQSANNNAQIYNILLFGADRTGVAASTTAIQNAINAAHVSGGKVYVPVGTYLTNKLTTYNNVMIVGDGIGYSILKSNNADTLLTLQNNAFSFTSPILQDIKLDGNATGTVALSLKGIASFSVERVFIHNFTSKGMYLKGVLIGAFRDITIDFCQIGVYSDSTVIGSTSTETNLVSWDNCRFYDCSTHGVEWRTGALVQFTNCDFERDGTLSTFTTGSIYIRQVANFTAQGVGAVIDKCWFEANSGTDIYVDTTTAISKTVVSNSMIWGGNSSGNTQGLYVTAGSTSNRISVDNCNIIQHTTDAKATGANASIDYYNSTITTTSATSSASITPNIFRTTATVEGTNMYLFLNSTSASTSQGSLVFSQQGTAKFQLQYDPNNNGTSDLSIYQQTPNRHKLYITSGGDVRIGAQSSAASTAGMVVDNSSNVGFNNNAMYYDAANNRLGIGTSTTPSYQFHVKKNQNTSTELAIENANGTSGAASIFRFITSSSHFSAVGMNDASEGGAGADRIYLYNQYNGVALRAAGASSDIKFYTGGDNERMSISSAGKVAVSSTQTAGGTTGAQTINKPSGSVNFAASATTLVVTNSLVTTSSNVFIQVEGTDATFTSARVTKASGSFTITANAAATAETRVSFWVIN